jgi:hypothetical protein
MKVRMEFGIYLTSDLSWNTHVEYMCGKASKRLYILRILKRRGFSVNHLRKVFCSFIRPILEYACRMARNHGQSAVLILGAETITTRARDIRATSNLL